MTFRGKVLGVTKDPTGGLSSSTAISHHNTRSTKPRSGNPAPPNDKLTPPLPPKAFSASRLAQRKLIDDQVDFRNPTYMYPKSKERAAEDAKEESWFRDEKGQYANCIPDLEHTAIHPIKSHVYSTVEMKQFAATKFRESKEPKKSFKDIIQAAIAMRSNLRVDKISRQFQSPPGVFIPVVHYDNQDLVNIKCCLVDRRREFAIDTQFDQKWKTHFSIRIDSYVLAEDKSLDSYVSGY
jgi:hypothetical protein